jgi:RNA-splicing ligase RtcB
MILGRVDITRLMGLIPNIVLKESGLFVHRKGATPAHAGQPMIIPGSMGHPSFLLMGQGNTRFLSSASHGAGRAVNRFMMGRKHRLGEDLGLDGVECITLKEERRIEEAPASYKDVGPVVDIQVQEGIATSVAQMAPILTFKG